MHRTAPHFGLASSRLGLLALGVSLGGRAGTVLLVLGLVFVAVLRPHVPASLTGTATTAAGVESVMLALGLLVLASARRTHRRSAPAARHPPVRLTAPRQIAGLPMQVTVHAPAAPDAARIFARSGALRRVFSARRD